MTSTPGSSKKGPFSRGEADLYAVQCARCFKWRVIESKDEYETIRENLIDDPWYCDKNPEGSCDDPGDLEYNTSRLWVIDKPNIPRAPPNTERKLVMRKDLSKFDTHYIMPNGKKVRSTMEVTKFLEAHPEYKDQFSLSDFSFTPPKISEEMVPRKSEGKSPLGGSNKRSKTKEG